MQKANILIAEDDPMLREAYVRRFARTSFKVQIAENGDEALRMIGQKAPDLLICDIMMPKKDGWAVLEQLPKDRSFPVIMLTNLNDDDTQKRLKDLKVDGFLVKKDMTLHSLVETTEKLLKNR